MEGIKKGDWVNLITINNKTKETRTKKVLVVKVSDNTIRVDTQAPSIKDGNYRNQLSFNKDNGSLKNIDKSFLSLKIERI